MDVCRELPTQETAQRQLKTAQQLQDEWMALQMESQMLPPLPEAPEIPAHYRDVDAVAVAQADVEENDRLEKKKKKTSTLWTVYIILSVLGLVTVAALRFVAKMYLPWISMGVGIAVFFGGIVVAIIGAVRTAKIRKALQQIYNRHPGLPEQDWLADAQKFADEWKGYELLLENARDLRADLERRTADLKTRMDELTGTTSMTERQGEWTATVAAWDALGDARRDLQRTESHAQALRAMARILPPPEKPDELSYTAEETDSMLSEARLKQQQLNVKLGQCLGQTESLGSEALIRARLDTLNRRIARLEDTFYALEMAQDALREATNMLQRRFAPRIAKRAQELFSRLTDGRYTRLTLGQDFTLSTSAEDEDTLRSAQWRSDGTADQQYLALRLAVAAELTPEAPLILDDALVRFDDQRLAKAMEILKEEADQKQVILFTCQSREKQMEEAR